MARRTRSSATDRRTSRPRSTTALASTNEADASAAWSTAQDILARDLPIVPILHSTPPGAYAKTLNGFQGNGNLTEFFNTVWLTQ